MLPPFDSGCVCRLRKLRAVNASSRFGLCMSTTLVASSKCFLLSIRAVYVDYIFASCKCFLLSIRAVYVDYIVARCKCFLLSIRAVYVDYISCEQ